MYYRLVHVGALHTKACIEGHVIRFLTRSVEIGNTEGVKSKLPTATDVTFWFHPRFSSCRLDGLALLCCLVNSKWLFMIILYCIGNTCGVLRLPTVIDRDKVVLVCIVYRPPKPRTRQNERRVLGCRFDHNWLPAPLTALAPILAWTFTGSAPFRRERRCTLRTVHVHLPGYEVRFCLFLFSLEQHSLTEI